MDVGLQPGPARKPIPLGNLELRLAHRTGVACFEQVFCLIFEMSEMGTIGKRAEKVRRIGRHSDPLSSKRPLSALRAKRRFAKTVVYRWASTLSADRMRPVRCADLITAVEGHCSFTSRIQRKVEPANSRVSAIRR